MRNIEQFPVSSTNAERREELYEKLEKKKETIDQLIKLFYSNEFEGQELVSQAEEIIMKAREKSSEEAVAGLESLRRTEQEMDNLREKANRLMEKNYTKSTSKSLKLEEELYEKIIDKIDERNQLYADNDIRFLYILEEGLGELKLKAKSYEAFKNDPEKFEMPECLSGIEKENMRISGVSVSFIIDDQEYSNKIDESSSGVHFGHTIFNVIRDNKKEQDIEKTILHEDIHCFYECFNGRSIISFDDVQDTFHGLSIYSRKTGLAFLFEKEKKKFEHLAKDYFFSSQGELVANVDELIKGNLATELSKYNQIIINIRSLIEYTKKSGIPQEKKKELEKLVLNFENDIIANFRDFFIKLSDDIFIAREENKTDDLKSLMMLFTPGQYHKIGKYLEHEIGPDKYKMYQIIRRIIKGPYFEDLDMKPKEKMLGQILFGEKHVNINTSFNIRSAGHPFAKENIQALREIKNFDFEISESLRQAVAAAMKKENFYILGRELGYKTHAQLQDYIKLVRELAAALKLDIDIKE